MHLSLFALATSNFDIVVDIVIVTIVVASTMLVRKTASGVVVARSAVPELVHGAQGIAAAVLHLELGKDDFGTKVLHSNTIIGAVGGFAW